MKPQNCYRSAVFESKEDYKCKPGIKIPFVILTPKEEYDKTGYIADGGQEYGEMYALIGEDLTDILEGVFTPIDCFVDFTKCKANGAPTIIDLPEKAMSKKELEAYLDNKGFQYNPKLDDDIKYFVEYL